jgi:uncharacterized membrane protein|tara:strand:- start:1507 stop:1902 length:396 start_codon:yes stop_codon:yes gene_type:complete
MELPIVVLCSTLMPFVKKQALKDMRISQFLLLQGFFLLPLNIIQFFIRDGEIKDISLKNKWFFLSIFNTFLCSLAWMSMLQKKKISDFIPILQPSIIVFTCLIDTFMGNKVDVQKAWACVIIIIGILMFNF